MASPTRNYPPREPPPPSQSLRWLQLRSDELRGRSLDDVSRLEVGEPSNLDTALEVLGDFPDVVLEPAQRLDLAIEHDGCIAEDAHLRVARDLAALHVAARDRADLRDLE